MNPTFHLPEAQFYIPDALEPQAALARTTHLAIGAHQDDLEFMAFHGILACYDSAEQWFGGVTCTNGAGSARTGPYAGMTDEALQTLRAREQNEAAHLARYSFMAQLAYPSAIVKKADDTRLRDDLLAILHATRPQVVYTHNLADKHDTHIGVAIATIEALRALPPELRPQALYGCEGWRGLDWLDDQVKVIHDVGGHDDLASSLNGLFDSQIAGGKRYDLAVMGRRRANATFFDSHSTDKIESAAYDMDLTPLITHPDLDLTDFVLNHIRRFEADVRERIGKRLGRSTASKV